ncbi:hypothetical protein Hanom_Chr15g01378341 [Helianthus anomalus]
MVNEVCLNRVCKTPNFSWLVLLKFGNMVKTLIYRKYQRHIHHVSTMLHLFRYSVSCCILCLTIHSSTLYDYHAPIIIIPCALTIILIVA